MRRIARRLLPVLLPALLAGLLLPVPATAYVRFAVENHGAAQDPAYVEQVTTLIADIHKAFVSTLRLRVTSDVHVGLKFYKERTEYEKDANAQGRMRNYSTLPPAFYQHNPMAIWAVDSANRDELTQMILHESTHMFLHNLAEDCPIWIHEGLAESFQGAVLHQGRFVLRPYPDRDKTAKEQLGKGTLPGLAAYIDLDRTTWQQQDSAGQPVRAHSWSICWFLLSSPEGRQLLNDLIRAHQAGRRIEPCSALADRYWRGGTKALEAAWRAWIPGQRSPMPLDIPNPAETSLTTIIR